MGKVRVHTLSSEDAAKGFEELALPAIEEENNPEEIDDGPAFEGSSCIMSAILLNLDPRRCIPEELPPLEAERGVAS